MSLTEKIQQIDRWHRHITEQGKLSDELLKKINYKFRLDWNYYSNSMEGNSLTRQETRSVMVGNITVDGKPIKDVLEMKGHDDVISQLLKMGQGELNLSEKRIKEIHKAIMHEDDPEKAKQVGQWKVTANHLINYKGEKFDFVAPAEVAERMHQLMNWLGAEKEKIQRHAKDALHPVLLAFQFHLDYVSIHPFFDGNGRTARIFTNLILIAYGYPPIYIKTDEKTRYYQYLADIQGYGGSPDLYYEFMADLLLRSLGIVRDAVEGRDIEEDSDWEKRLALLKQELSVDDQSLSQKTPGNVSRLINDFVLVVVKLVFEKFSKFDDLFLSKKLELSVNDEDWPVVTFAEIENKLHEFKDVQAVEFSLVFRSINRTKKIPSYFYQLGFAWHFDTDSYTFTTPENAVTGAYWYRISREEIEEYINLSAKELLDNVAQHIRNS